MYVAKECIRDFCIYVCSGRPVDESADITRGYACVCSPRYSSPKTRLKHYDKYLSALMSKSGFRARVSRANVFDGSVHVIWLSM